MTQNENPVYDRYSIEAGGDGVSGFGDHQHDLVALEIPFSGDFPPVYGPNTESWLFRVESGPWAGKNAAVTSRYTSSLSKQLSESGNAVVILHILQGEKDQNGFLKVQSVGYSRLFRVSGDGKSQ